MGGPIIKSYFSSVHDGIGSPVREMTAVLLPGKTLSLYLSGGSGSGPPRRVRVTATVDSGAWGEEQVCQWLQLLQNTVADSPLL